MICVSYIFVTFLFFETIICQQQFPTLEYAQFDRMPPSSNLRQLKNQGRPVLVLAKDINKEDTNVQKLIQLLPEHKKMYATGNNLNEDPNSGPVGGPTSLGKSKLNKMTQKGTDPAPKDINRAQKMTSHHWPMGIIPYFVDNEIYDAAIVKRIVKAMSAIESVSCVIFRELEKKPKNSTDGWLHFTNPTMERECVHEFSTNDKGTEVVLGFDCLRPSEILHSLLHGLGFRDEVTHPRRDRYVRVLWNNIQPKYRGLFQIRYEDAAFQVVEYDPMSIMHFHDRAFSDNGAPTIAVLVPGLHIVPSTTLSQLDIMKLKLAFSHECNKRSIDDLFITCKNSLAAQKNSQDKNSAVPVQDDQKNEAEQKLEEEMSPEGQNSNDSKHNPDEIDNLEEENNKQLTEENKEKEQPEIEYEQAEENNEERSPDGGERPNRIQNKFQSIHGKGAHGRGERLQSRTQTQINNYD